VSYDKAITLDLSQPLTLSLSANSVLGLPVAASAKVTLSAGGVSEIDLTTKAPAMLGGASAALDLKSDQTHGLQVSSAHLDLGQVSIGKLTAGKVTLDYASGAPGGSSWTVSGTLSVPNVVSGSLNGSVTYDGNGKLTAGSLTLPSLKLVGLASVSSFTLATTDGMSWTGSGSATTAGGGSAQSVKFAYTVDESNGSITADITVGKLVVPDAFTLTGFALSYSSGSWSVKGSVTAAGGSKTSDLTGSFTVAADGKTTGSLSASNVPLAGIATVASLSLTFDSSTKTYSGDLSLTLPGGSAPVTFKASIVDGVLQSASADKLDLKLGAVNLTGASFSYDSTKHSYAVAASDANVANLVHLDDFSMSAQVGTSSWSFQVKGQVQSDGDKGASIDGSIDVADGSISSASLTVSGINIGHFLPLDAVSFSYTKDTGVWKGSAGKTGGPSVAIEIDMPGGTLTGGSLDIKDVELGGAAHISEISAKMDASGDWSFSGKADVGGDQDDLSVDLTYSDGTLTDAKITGKLSIKNLLTIDVTDASYTAATESYSLSVQLTMPGPEGGTVGGSIKIENGLFTSGSFSIDSNGPGVPLGEAVFLTGGSFTLTVSPTLSMGGTVDFTVGPRLPVVGAAVSGDVGLTWTNSGGAGTFTLKGDVKIGGQQIANGTVTYDTSAGTVVFDGTLGINVGVLSASGALHGSITPDSFDLSAGVTASLLGVASATAQVEITDTGISGCAQLNSDYNWHAGFTYQWGDAWPPQPLKGACDLGAFAPAGGASADAFSARALATPATRGMRASLRADDVVAPAGTFTVPDGQDVYAVEFVGSDAPPQITLTAPDGTTTFTTPADPADDGVQPGGRYVVLRDASTNTTYFLLDTPAAGTWTAQVVSGTVSTMAVAIQRPQPTVAASLSGSGSTRTLDYTVAPVGSGQSVQFVETASDGVSQYLGAATTDSAGSVTFTPLTDSGTHTVSAEVLQDGLVRTTVDLLTFTPSSTEVTTIKQPTTPPGTAPRIRLSAPATPVGAGDAVDLTATVTIPNSGADTGTVQCYSGTTGDDSDPLGTPVSLAVTGGAGSGTCVVTGLAEGVHSLWARFTGTDGTLDSAALPLSVRAASSSGGGATGG
ncbi:MAG TPA: Ig-like domain repeat protein, partial [Jatrophihabitantaceae bacterium]|nr:Ig-like domain repeat protein [Jatrophihabitantaceae bacterium]